MSLETARLSSGAGWPSLPLDPAFRVVALGGGTGLPVTLRGLKRRLFSAALGAPRARARDRLTAIVTVGDDGGSSGRLRRLYGVLPPGDIRNCLLALSDGDPALRSLFDFRFRGEGEIAGHSLGNLILTALSLMGDDLSRAVEQASQILDVRGTVLPSSPDPITLRAHLTDGRFVDGESRIARARGTIRRLSILPRAARGHPQALRAISRADLIVIGPGSLYTSLIPVLLIEDLAEAIRRSGARTVLVANLMTEPGETDGYSVADLIAAVRLHVPGLAIHDVLVNRTPMPDELAERYAAEGSAPIRPDERRLRSLGCRPVLRDLIAAGPKLRHDPGRLGQVLLELAAETQREAVHA